MRIIMTKINIDAGGTQLNTYNIHNINFFVVEPWCYQNRSGARSDGCAGKLVIVHIFY